MRVVIAALVPHTSGISTYTAELAKTLSHSHEVVLLGFGSPTGYDIPPTVRYVEIEPHSRYTEAAPLLELVEMSKVIAPVVLREFTGYVMHETLPGVALGIPGGVTTRYGYISYPRLAWVRTIGLRNLEAVGSGAVTFQHWLLDRAARRLREATLSVSGRGLFIRPPMSISPPVRRTPQSQMRVLFVARDVSIPRKNLRFLLGAARKAWEMGARVELYVVGESSPRVERSARAVFQGVTFFGQLTRARLREVMTKADVLVNPSTYEEIGYINLEAMATGLPCMVSDLESFRAILGDSALYFDPFAIHSLTRLLQRFSREPESLRSIGTSARRQLELEQPRIRSQLTALYASVHPVAP